MLSDGDISIDEALLQSLRTVLRDAHARGVPTARIIETVAAITGNLLGAGATGDTSQEDYQRMLKCWCEAFHSLHNQAVRTA